MPDVIVVGAGLAGLSCALDLVERGATVRLLEERDILGGRTSSWVQDGMLVESGLHKFLGIYRALPKLLHRVGVAVDDIVVWTDELEFHIPGGPNALFCLSPFHHPVSTLSSSLGNTDFLPTTEKAKLAAAASAGVARAVTAPQDLDARSLADFARDWSVSEEIIGRVLSTSTQAVLFLGAEDFSAYAAFAPLVEAVKNGLTMRIGAFTGPMTEVMIKPIVQAIQTRGGTVRPNTRVLDLLVEEGKVVGVKTESELLRAEHIVLATPLNATQELLRPHFSQREEFQAMLTLASHSASTIQLELDVPLLDRDHTNFSSTDLCCFAEQSRTTFRGVPGRLSGILFPPEKYLNMADEDLFDEVCAAASAMGLSLREHVQRFRVVHHPHDFYAMRPGSEGKRPNQVTDVPGLLLAGDFTKQRFSASMEGAVISGQLAAAGIK